MGQVTEGLADADFKFFSYEGNYVDLPPGTQSSVAYRESYQAKAIAQYMRDHPNAKILIHAGYAHIKKDNIHNDIEWMAERFVMRTGIDPLTISQTYCSGVSAFEGGTLGYALLADADGRPISRGSFDLIMVAPQEKHWNGRPLWLRDHLGRHFVDIPEVAQFDGASDFTLITARQLGRPNNTPPEDRIYRAPRSNKVLALRPGVYKIVVTDRNKVVLATVEVVDAP